ncbi:hypothetical protein EV12_0458 [Prochlorococcus sp. MIT 0701]|nr:hypothetical protein EV12_0458 [Prochlorococcus sp. MIT 0701]
MCFDQVHAANASFFMMILRIDESARPVCFLMERKEHPSSLNLSTKLSFAAVVLGRPPTFPPVFKRC